MKPVRGTPDVSPVGRARRPAGVIPASAFGFVGERLGYILHRADLRHMGLIRELLADIGLTPARATALAFIQANLGQGQAELGRALEINRASTMELVNSLVALDAVERREGRDRRSHSLFLTERGQALFAQFQKISVEVDGIITSQMSPDEIDMLSRLLTAMQNGVDSYLDSKGRKK